MIRKIRLEYVLAALVLVGIAFYARAEYVPSFADRHVQAAEESFELDIGDVSPWFSAWSIGDGQAFAVIAADPTGTKLSQEVQEPAYRFVRAGFGWSAAVASLGREAWIPYGMALVGAVSLMALFALAMKQRKRLGTRSWLLILNPAIYLGFAGDTAEPLGVLLLAVGISTGSVWAAVALGVTRPSYLVAFLGRWRQVGWGVVATVLLLGYALVRFGADQFLPGQSRLDLPFSAYMENSTVAGWILAVIAVATLSFGIRDRDWAWVASGLLVLCLGSDVTADPVNAWRAAGMLPVLWAFGTNYRAADEPSSAETPTSVVASPT